MNTSPRVRPVSRRAAVAGIAGSGLALAVRSGTAIAQDNTGDLAGHPLVGTWVVMTPGGISLQTFGPDGSTAGVAPPSYVDPMLGLTLQGTFLGRWEASGERSGHFTLMQSLSAPDGTYLGTFQFEADPEMSEDGQTWSAGTPQRVIVRDAANNVTLDEVFPMDPPITATRMGATMESVVLPVATPAAATSPD